jgi:hypothetical protein
MGNSCTRTTETEDNGNETDFHVHVEGPGSSTPSSEQSDTNPFFVHGRSLDTPSPRHISMGSFAAESAPDAPRQPSMTSFVAGSHPQSLSRLSSTLSRNSGRARIVAFNELAVRLRDDELEDSSASLSFKKTDPISPALVCSPKAKRAAALSEDGSTDGNSQLEGSFSYHEHDVQNVIRGQGNFVPIGIAAGPPQTKRRKLKLAR